MDLLLDMVCAVDGQGRFVYVSAACERMLGYRADELTGKVMMDFVHPDDREATHAVADRVMQGESVMHFENRYLHRNGHGVDILWSARWFAGSGLRLGVAKDVTELKKAQRMQSAMLAVSQAASRSSDLEMLCQQLHEAVALLIPVSRVTLSLQQDGRSYSSRAPFSGRNIRRLRVPLALDAGIEGELIIEKHYGDGPLEPSADELLRFISEQTISAVARLLQEERLLHMAHFDPLTGLPNRLLFEDRFTTALYRAIRDGEQVGLLYMDLVGFKATNDTLGHEAGDGLLRQVGERLCRCLRASDTVGRPGGDEFTALLVNSGGTEQVRGVMRKIQVAMEEGFTIGGHPVTVSVSIGMALYPDDGTDTATLYRVADRAMYASRAVSMLETGSLSGR